MIRIEGAQATPDEIAAITAVIAATLRTSDALAPEPRSPWKLANRRPELDLDALRAAVRTAP